MSEVPIPMPPAKAVDAVDFLIERVFPEESDWARMRLRIGFFQALDVAGFDVVYRENA